MTASTYIYRAPGSYTYGAVNGINANNFAGSLTITALGISTGGTGNGIRAYNYYNAVNQGGLTITSNNAYGNASGVYAVNYGAGALSITTTGNTYGTNGFGVYAYNQSANPLTINVGYLSSVRGGVAGISAYNYGGGITINSFGYISDFSNTDSGLAITTVFGGATTVNNYAGGFVRGRMNLSNFSDTVNNSGLWVTEGTSNFGGGVDTVNNSGLTVTGNLGGFREVTTLSNLETFNNTGTFDMSDDIAGNGFGNGDNTNDQTFMPSANWNGGGGSTLLVDAFLGAPGAQSDELHVNTTSGVTTINVVDNNAGPGSFNPTGILVVDANASSAGDFTLGTLTSVNGVAKVLSGRTVFDKGLFFYDLLFDAPNNDHLLVSLPDQEAFELTQLPAAASNIWHTTTGVWLDRTADIRNLVRHGTTAGFAVTPTADFGEPVSPAQKAGFGVWGKGVGAWTDRDASDGFTLFNQAFNFDTSYDQDTYGFLAGIDGGIDTGDGGTLVFGVLGGYVKSDVEFDASPTETEFEGAMVGGYITYLNGGWFVDAMVKADLLDMDHDAPTLAPLVSSADADADSIGVRVDGGYRFDVSPGFFLEPQATFAWVHTDIDSFTLAGAAISHDDADSIRLSGGLRAGMVVSDADGMRVEASVMGRVWAELGDDNDMTIATAGPPLTLSDDFGQAYDIYGDVSGIVNVISTDGPKVFVKGGVQFNDDFVTGNVQGGLGFEF